MPSDALNFLKRIALKTSYVIWGFLSVRRVIARRHRSKQQDTFAIVANSKTMVFHKWLKLVESYMFI
jgi:hypothetical protein